MPRTERKTKPAKAPKWASFKTPKAALEALWKYMATNDHFGARDTEPKYDVRNALRGFKLVPETDADCWELYSSMPGVGQVNRQIAKAVNVAIGLTQELGFSAAAVVDIWEELTWIKW